MKRPSKTVTHVVFGVGGDGNAVVGGLDEGALLVGPSWVEACEGGRCEAPTLGHEWKEEEALEAAGSGEEAAAEEAQQETAPKKTAKKKKTKKRAARRAADVPRDGDGAVVLPFTVGTVTVTSLGELVAGDKYCCETALYPVGFASEAMRPSYKHPAVKVRYQMSVERGEEGPLFRLVCPHDTANPLVGSSADEVCLRAATLLAEASDKMAPSKARGDEWFGLSSETVRRVLQQLPGAEQCEGYKRLEEGEEEAAAKEEAQPEEAVEEEEVPKKRQKKKAKKKPLKAGAPADVRAAKRAEKDAARAKRDEEALLKQQAKCEEADKKAAKKKEEADKRAEKKQQEAEAKRKEKEEAEAKKNAAQPKLFQVMRVVKREEKKDATVAAVAQAAAPPQRQWRVAPEALLAQIGDGSRKSPLPGVPDDYLEHARQLRSHGGSSSGQRRATRTLRFWDDCYRPAYSVQAAAFRRPGLSGRRPLAAIVGRDYEDESDDDWEGWDVQEESVGDDGDDEPEEEAEDEGFVVPDTLIELEDGQVVNNAQALPTRTEARARFPHATPLYAAYSSPAHAAVLFRSLPISVSQRPSNWPAAALASPALDALTPMVLDASAPAAAAAPAADKPKKAPKLLAAEASACLARVLEQQQQPLSKKQVVDAALAAVEAAHPTMKRPSRMAMERGLAAMADKKGKTWVLKQQEPADAPPQPK